MRQWRLRLGFGALDGASGLDARGDVDLALVLLSDTQGLPLGYTRVPASEHEYEPLADLLTSTAAEVLVADKGFWGRGPDGRREEFREP